MQQANRNLKNMLGPCRNAVHILLNQYFVKQNPSQVFQLAISWNVGIYQLKNH